MQLHQWELQLQHQRQQGIGRPRTTMILSPVDVSWVHKRCRVRWWGLEAQVLLKAGSTAPAAAYGNTMEPPYMTRGMSHTRNLHRGTGPKEVGGGWAGQEEVHKMHSERPR